MKKNQGLIPDEHEPLVKQIVALHEFRFGKAATRKFLVDAAAFKVGPLAELTVSAFLSELAGGIPAPVVPEPAPTPAPVPVPPPPPPVPVAAVTNDFAGVKKWSGANSSGWKQTITIRDVKIRGKNFNWSGGLERVGKWNEFTDGGKRLNGECCLIFGDRAGFFDYLGQKQNAKLITGNIPEFLGRMPAKGERVGFFLRTIDRKSSARKMRECSNVVWMTWP